MQWVAAALLLALAPVAAHATDTAVTVTVAGFDVVIAPALSDALAVSA